MNGKKALLLTLFALLALAGVAKAASEVTHFAQMQVSIWPEYDQPSVLVMYNIFLPKNTKLPAELEIPIPARAGEPHAVAYIQPNGTLINAQFTYSANQEWGTVELKALHPAIHIEYYDPALTKEGKHRTFVFSWPGGFVIDSFKLVVQQPKQAKNMRFTPKMMGEGQQESDGLVYYHADVGALKASDAFELKIEYDKDTDELSAAAPPTQNLAKSIKGETSFRTVLPWVALALGLALILGGVMFYWNLQRAQASNPIKRQRRRKQPLPPEARAADAEDTAINYCPVCGARVHPGDKYCRVCGTKLR